MIVLTDAQWLCIRSFLHSCSGLYVGNETRCRLFVTALCWMARSGASWRRLPSEYGKGNLVYRRLRPRVRSGRLIAPDGLPVGRAGAVRGAAGPHGRARTRARRARPKKGAGSRPRTQPGRLQHQDPHPGGSTGTSLVSALDGRPVPRQHPGPSLGQGLDRRAPALPDRRPGL